MALLLLTLTHSHLGEPLSYYTLQLTGGAFNKLLDPPWDPSSFLPRILEPPLILALSHFSIPSLHLLHEQRASGQ